MTCLRPVLLLLVALLTACALPVKHETAAATPPLLLVSIDGFRADYLDRGLTPTLRALADGGVRAEFMRPSFPSLTFPNHYTLITGLRPDRNGIVANAMEDETMPGERFSSSNRVAVENARWWDEAVPLWTSVQRTGRRAATMFWPGSEAPVHGAHPDHWARFDAKFGEIARVDTLLGWLDAPAPDRPSLMTLYFDSVDVVGHHDGPDSPNVDAALRAVDLALAHLLAGLERRGLRDAVNLVIVSDHGMSATSAERVVYFDDIIADDHAHVVMWGALTGVVPKSEHRADVERVLLSAHPHMQCHRKTELPARLHYGSNRRIPPILCIAEHGWVIGNRAGVARRKHFPLGGHGYDIDHPEMRALFIGHGPAFRQGVVVPPFDNVDVYPLLAHLLDITPEPNDGDIDHVRAALR